jgi:DNA-binding NarL/FixJ family response regulator
MRVMGSTVLIVDDHPSFRASARAVLQADGFSVVGEAANGAEALAKVRELEPDVVVLDVQLPDSDGFEIAARLGANGRSPAVVLVSSRDEADYGDLIRGSGARGFVAKAELSGPAVRALLE